MYREEGAGDPVLLVHGWSGSGYDWTRLIPQLSDSYHVFAPDLPGFGRSDKPGIDYTLDYYVKFIDDFANEVGMDSFHLAGNSMGGQISAAYSLAFPEKVRTLALLDAAGVTEGVPAVFGAGRFPRSIERLMARTPLRLFAWHYRKVGPYYDPSWMTDEDIREHYHSYGNRPAAHAAASCLKNILLAVDARLDEKLEGLSLPSLIIWGKEDPMLPLVMGDEFKRLIKGSTIEVIDMCGHCPQEEHPERTAAILKEFWTKS